MSKMGRAVFWIQENELQDDPNALTLYVDHLKKQKMKKQPKRITKAIAFDKILENLEERKLAINAFANALYGTDYENLSLKGKMECEELYYNTKDNESETN